MPETPQTLPRFNIWPIRVALRALALLVLVAGCTGSPASPSQNVAVLPPAAALPSGRYTMVVTSGPSQSGSLSVLLCAGRSGNEARLTVDVTAADSGWRGTAANGTLVFTLTRSGADVAGPISGRGTAVDGTVVEFGDNSIGITSGTRGADLAGTLEAPGVVRGRVDGDVMFRYSVGYGSCSGNAFTLTR